jgi:hypothetical protein
MAAPLRTRCAAPYRGDMAIDRDSIGALRNMIEEVDDLISTTDPQLNRQAPDVGTSYRSAIFHPNGTKKRLAEAYIVHLDGSTSSRNGS